MNRKASTRFFGRGHSEQVETQIVAHDARQELGVRARPEMRCFSVVNVGWLDGLPVRHPQGTDAGALIEDLGDVAALLEDGHTQEVVFEMDGRRP